MAIKKHTQTRHAPVKKKASASHSQKKVVKHAVKKQLKQKASKPVKAVIVKPIKKTKKEEAAEQAIITKAAQTAKLKEVLQEPALKEYFAKSIGTHAANVINTLVDGPREDETISEQLSIKLNEARRTLNLLNSYGIVRYNINRDTNGWLTFLWYIDHGSVHSLKEEIGKAAEAKSSLPDGCNDFFACPKCSKSQAMVLPFEVAFESTFKCSCGKSLARISKEEAEGFYTAMKA